VRATPIASIVQLITMLAEGCHMALLDRPAKTAMSDNGRK
jgi:hypothetical protein